MQKKTIYFIHIPKTAGTFLTEVLKLNLGDRFVREGHTIPQGTLRPWTERFGPEHYHSVRKEECFTISVVRNPFDLLVSMYVWGFPFWPPKNYVGVGHINWPFVSFKDFVLKITDPNGYPWLVPEQKKSLYFQIFDGDGSPIPDVVLRQENLAEGVIHLGHMLGEDWNVPNNRVNQSNTNSYTEFYDKELVDVVENHFLGDLRAFGYGFGHSDSSAVINTDGINCDISGPGYKFPSSDFAPIRNAIPTGTRQDINYHRLEDFVLPVIPGRKLISEIATRTIRRSVSLLPSRYFSTNS